MSKTVEVVRERERERELYLEKNNRANNSVRIVKKINRIINKGKNARIGYLASINEKQKSIKRIKLLQDSLSFL